MNKLGAGDVTLSRVKRESQDTAVPKWKILVTCADTLKTEHHYNPLDAFIYDDQAVTFLYASSQEDVLKILQEQKDIAVLLVDVSGENGEPGLKLIQRLRQDIGNKTTRIILFGVHSGYLQDWNILRQYDVNDYRDVSELTVPQLFTSLTVALQSYDRLISDEDNRQALQTILDVTKELYGVRSVEEFCLTILTQLQVIH